MFHAIGRRRRHAKAFLLATAATLASASASYAQVKHHQFDIPAGDAVVSLQAFSKQAGVQTLFSYDAVAGKHTPAVHGDLPDQQVLDELAKSAGLSIASNDGHTITLQPLPAPAPKDPAPVSQAAVTEVIVTGSRVTRNGYSAPTPVTVVGIDELRKLAPTNIADYVNTLPSLVGSVSPDTSRTTISAGGAGLNNLNLRNLGVTRTLVLIDGRRSVGSQNTGVVDINTIPEQLVERIDVVTGGASAAYGSDAVAGVVNFVLDNRFTGFKGEVQGGMTTYGDDGSWKLALTGGTTFGGGRGHFIISGEAAHNDGIKGVPRPWAKQGINVIPNPAYAVGNGQPLQLLVAQTAQSNQTLGGIITSGPLKGTAFGPGGVPYKFNYGPIVKDPWMQGGDWQANNIQSSSPGSYSGVMNNLDSLSTRENVYARMSYDITPYAEIFATFNYAYSEARGIATANQDPGDITLSVNNAYLPAPVAAQAKALGVTSFSLGTLNGDGPPVITTNIRRVERYVVGGDGAFDAFGSNWHWDAYYQTGFANAHKKFIDRQKSRLALAEQAVVNPANGQIVCASTLTNPNNGCVPFDFFGMGVNSPAAINYLWTQAYSLEKYSQQVGAASLRGEPFSIWAGPVSVATGVEHRVEGGGGIQSAANAVNDYVFGNQSPVQGSYNVTEGFVETVVPLAKDNFLAKSLDFNAAVRFTGYSTSGEVTTWKLGLTYAPIDSISFRATRSLDIRAPNRSELFSSGVFAASPTQDPFHNNTVVTASSDTIGNLNLKPEEAYTSSVGVVARPTFLPGFGASVDYWDINIKNAISTVSAQDVANRCFAGETVFCSDLTFNPTTGFLSTIIVQPINFVVQRERGIDFDASYRFQLDGLAPHLHGGVALRALATHFITDYTNDGKAVTQFVGNNGTNGPPHWKYSFSATYTKDALDLSLMGRGFSSGVYSNQLIACTSGCPLVTGTVKTQNYDSLPGALYWDATITYRFSQMEAFFSVRNIFDSATVVAPTNGGAFSTPPCNSYLYDCLGRQFQTGVRFKY